MSESWVDMALEQIEELTPESGFNVVGVDSMARPGEALYLVEHCETLEEAEKVKSAHEAESGDLTHIYSPRENK